ncbi:MAG TPA: AAA family ATPase [Streptosporangiaceae bacterium]
MRGPAPAGTTDEIQRMQEGVRDWVRQPARQARGGPGTDSPVIVLSRLCASAFTPLLMAGDAAGAELAVLSSAGSQDLSQAVTGALARSRRHPQPHVPSRDELEEGIARQIQQALTPGDERANALRSEIASVLKRIDAGGTALRAAMDEANDRVRTDVFAAISVLSSGFSEMAFLIKDAAKAAERIQKRLDAEGAKAQAIIERNERQSTDVRLVREDLAAGAGRVGAGGPSAAEPGKQVALWVHGCPYRGLLPFGEADAGVFYGRERLAAALAAKLATRVTRGGLVVVTGASGAGKSSLLQAGLLPILARGQQVQGSSQWPRIVMIPTKDPMTELAAHLAALDGGDTIAVRDRLVQHPDEGHLAVWSAVLAATARRGRKPPVPGDGAARLVLVVDQFEQVFTLNPGPEGDAARRAFVTALCAAATNQAGPGQEPPALVVIALRADFWDRCAALPQLAGALHDGQFLVGPMTEPELRAAITGPATLAGLRIDPALTDTILSDLRAVGGDGAVGGLPLLSQAMALTWEKREGDQLTSHGYGQAGGVSHAVQTVADAVYDALPAAQQALARIVLPSMTVTADGRLACRPVHRNDLYAGLPGTARTQVDAVLKAFAAQHLVFLDGDWATISHDTLLRAWPRLRGWLEEDQASWFTYGRLADAADAWHDRRDDPSLLYRGADLTALQQAATRWSEQPARSPALTSTQRDFLQASGRAATRGGRRWRSTVALLAVLALAAAAVLVVVFQQRNTALQQRDQAIYNQTVAEALRFGSSNTPLAAQLNLAAYRLRPTPDLASRLLDLENTPLSLPLAAGTRGVGAVAFSPGGHLLAAGSFDGTVRLWDVADPAHPRLLGRPLNVGEAVESVAVSPNGHTLVTGTYFGTIALWDITNPAHPVALGLPQIAGGGIVYTMAFSPDGHLLATGDIDGTVRLWDVTDPGFPALVGQPLSAGGSIVYAVAFGPDGRTLATGSFDGTVRLWDVAHAAHPRLLGRPLATGSVVFGVAFAPDGHTLASGGADGTVRLWDIADLAHPVLLGRPLAAGSAVFGVAFSPDGHTLASGGVDGMVRLWDVADPAHPRQFGQPLTDGTNAVLTVAFSPDGHTLASGNGDGTVRLWNIPHTVLTVGAGAVHSVAFSPDGRTLATGGGDGTVRLWDAGNPARPVPIGRPLAAGTGPVLSMVFSPDGRTLATGSADHTVRLWDVANPAHPVLLGQPLTAGTGVVDSVAFSPNGRTLATGSGDAMVRLWDVADPAHAVLLGQPLSAGASIVYAVAFSHDGRTLASAGDDGMVRLWDVANPAHPVLLGQRLTVGITVVDSLAFSPSGHTLAVGSFDGTVRLWDVADPAHPRRLGRPVTTGAQAADSLAFSRDGHTLATGNGGGTVRVWDVTDPKHPRPTGQALAGGAGAVFSVAFSRDGHTLAVGTYDGAARLWNLDIGYAIEHICTAAGGLTPQQWHQYVPLSPYQSSCAH